MARIECGLRSIENDRPGKHRGRDRGRCHRNVADPSEILVEQNHRIDPRREAPGPLTRSDDRKLNRLTDGLVFGSGRSEDVIPGEFSPRDVAAHGKRLALQNSEGRTQGIRGRGLHRQGRFSIGGSMIPARHEQADVQQVLIAA